MAFAPRITRFIAIDLGDRRTGLAVADSLTRVASPWKTLEVPIEHEGGEKLIREIERSILRDYASARALEIVVGLPLHLDGRESDRSKLARVFAERVGTRLEKPVHLADERLTSKQADWAMGGSGLTHLQKKRRRDAIAAAALLQGFLDRETKATPSDHNDEPAHPNDAEDQPQGD
ncbi:MAG: Holliday junction resolvase RuvX [Planctomycetota bacterium]